MSIIIDILGREILDSRGFPTVEVDVILEDGSFGRAAVPSGASTGAHEAVELRDGEKTRYNGKGVLQAVNGVNSVIFEALVGQPALEQRLIDKCLIELDGTPNKERLGANALLAVSLAVARAAAESIDLPLYRYVGGCQAHTLPLPLMNILNGGVHADTALDFQEFMIVPVGAQSFSEALQQGCEIFYALKAQLKAASYNVNVGDEGGFAPALSSAEEALELVIKAIEAAGFKAGVDVALALDCAATEFFSAEHYVYGKGKTKLNREQQVEYLDKLASTYPIISIEDGMAEDDMAGWRLLTEKLGKKCQLVGDDLFVTHIERLEHGISHALANAILVKPNQVGTLSETLDAVERAKNAGYGVILSHRSGETEDSIIADLAVATNCGQIKTGSLSRSDRLAKYNQLLRIEEELGASAVLGGGGVAQILSCYKGRVG